MNVSQVMCRSVVTCSPDDTLDAAASKMWNLDIGCLPVVDGENRVVGMLTDRDVCMAAYTKGLSLKDLRVDSAMAHKVYTRQVNDRVQDVEAIMRRYRVRRVPVVDADGRLVGLVALNDLVREAANERTRRHPDVPADEVICTLATISEPRQTPASAAAE